MPKDGARAHPSLSEDFKAVKAKPFSAQIAAKPSQAFVSLRVDPSPPIPAKGSINLRG